MSAPLKALETRYAGCRFRSRLEARWAVFFDELHIQWEYEPQGFLVDGTPYLPDFWLPRQNVYYEVKPNVLLSDYRKRLELLAQFGKRRVVLAAGQIPRPDSRTIVDFISGEYVPEFFMEVFDPEGWDCGYAWCMCDQCGYVDVQFEGKAHRNCGCYLDDNGEYPGAYHPEILAAYAAARSARFEHGEVPRT